MSCPTGVHLEDMESIYPKSVMVYDGVAATVVRSYFLHRYEQLLTNYFGSPVYQEEKNTSRNSSSSSDSPKISPSFFIGPGVLANHGIQSYY